MSIRVITADIKRLARFNEQITGIAVTMYTEDFGELKTAAGTLAIGGTRTLKLFGGDVDAEFRRLADVIDDSLVQAPTTMP